MTIALTVVIAVIIFFLIITIHEAGHYYAARLFKMRVYEFSFGIGPALIKRRGKDGTLFSLKALPIGGSVQLGEDDEENSDPDSFRNKPVWQRMIVILAGAVLNLLLGLIVCFIVTGMNEKVVTTRIDYFADWASSSQKLQVGDEVLRINGMSVWTTSDISYQFYNGAVKVADENSVSFDFLVKRNGQKLLLDDVKFYAVPNEKGGKSIARDMAFTAEDKTFNNVVRESFGQMFSMSRIILLSLRDVVNGTYGLNDLSGFVGVADVIEQGVAEVIAEGETIGQSIFMGFDMMLSLLALITINVGIFNLLPIPALDGARFVFFVVEAVRRKPIKANVEAMIHFTGFALLMTLMLVVTFNDIRKLFLL